MKTCSVNKVNKIVNKILPVGKRGSLSDLIYIMVIFLTVAIAILVAKQIFIGINSSPGFMTDQPEAKNLMNGLQERMLPLYDVIFLGVFIAGLLGTLFMAYQLRTSPLFFWLGVLFLAIIVLLAAPLSNVYQEIVGSAAFSDATSNITFMGTIMNNLPLMITIIGALVLIVLYGLAKFQQEIL